MRCKNFGTIAIIVFLFAISLYSQDVVVNLRPYDGTPASYVNAQIVADTVAAGALLATHVYELERDQVFLHNAIFTVPNGKTLRLRAEEGSGKKPVIYLWETGVGTTPTRPPGSFVILNGGSLTMENICVAGFFEPEPDRVDGMQGGLIRTTRIGSTIVLDGVILSNINGQHVRTEQNTVKVQMTNSIFANMGALTTSNLGAGKGIDLRESACDSLILVNNTFVNYQDRAIRHYNFVNPAAGTGEIKYGRIEHNTFVNEMGFHGLFSLGNVGPEIIITNNLFVDAFALGEDSTDGTRAAEWANTGEFYPNGRNRITWIFTAPNQTTQWSVRNNYYAISDSGQVFLDDFNFPAGSPLSYHINGRLGADSVNAFTQTDLSLANTPRLMTNMMRWYEDPLGGNRSKSTENFHKETDDYDRRVIEFYRDTLDASYSASSAAYTGAEMGFPAGDLNWFPSLKALWEQGALPDTPELVIAPSSGAKYLNEQIQADHDALGNPDRVYILQREGVYFFNDVLTNSGWPLRIKAEEGAGKKPLIYLVTNATTGIFPTHFFEMEENLILQNIGLVGYVQELPDQIVNDPPRLIRSRIAGFDLFLDGCILSSSRGEHIRLEQATRVVKISNCFFGNMGDLGMSNLGAGKAIDFRGASCDSAIFFNNTFVNFQDRIVRHRLSTAPIHYFRFDHNTAINSMGYYGTLVLGWLGDEAIITSNLFIDTFIAGGDTAADRQSEFSESGELDPRNGLGRITWVYSVPNDITKWTVKGNYYSVSPAVQAFYDAHEAEGVLGEGPPLTHHINGRLGVDSVNAFIKEGIEVVNRPVPMVNMAEWYRSPSGGNKTRNTPCACWNRDTDDYDRRPVSYYMDDLDCTYPTILQAYTGAEGGFPAGDLNWYPSIKAQWLAYVEKKACPLTLSGDGITLTRTFGGHASGTDGFDFGLDELCPPLPQTYYAYFQISSFPNYLSTDIRGWVPPYSTSIDWMLKIVNANGISTTISWNPLTLPTQGSFTLTGAGNVDMRANNTVTFTGNKTLTIQYRSSVSIQYTFGQAGWYMVSLPVIPSDSSISALFPTALGGMAFGWDPTGTYTMETKMKPKKGYWLAIPGAATANVTGLPLNSYTEHFPAQGWYMIGSVMGNVNFINPNDNPNGSVLSPAFEWNSAGGMYDPATTLNEKEGYWIAVFNACDLTVGGAGGESPAPLAKADWEAFYARFGKTPPMPPALDGKMGKAMELPKTYGLFQNYPNPFNPETKIRYQIPDAVHVSLIIYNMMGQAVKKLVDSQQNAGYYDAMWNGKEENGLSLGSGMYVVRIEAGKFSSMRKIVLIR